MDTSSTVRLGSKYEVRVSSQLVVNAAACRRPVSTPPESDQPYAWVIEAGTQRTRRRRGQPTCTRLSMPMPSGKRGSGRTKAGVAYNQSRPLMHFLSVFEPTWNRDDFGTQQRIRRLTGGVDAL